MARVPEYGPSQQIETRPLGTPKQTTIASGALFGTGARQDMETGAALSNAGGAMLQVAARFQQRENADYLFRAETALKDDYLNYERQARERRGVDAFGLTEDTDKWWAEAERKHGEALKNDLQRQAFREQATRLRQASIGQISNYESSERRTSIAESAAASIQSSINTAASHPNDPAALAEQHTSVLDRTMYMAQENGWTPEQTELEVGKRLTQFHSAVIDAQVDNNPRAAKEYYEANKDEIDGTARDEIEKSLEIGNLRVRTQEIAEEVLGKGLSEAESLAYVREHYEGAEEDAAATRIKERFNEKDAAKTKRQQDASDGAWNAYLENGHNLDAIPVGVLRSMDPLARKSLEDYHRARVNSNADVQTDWDMYDAQLSMAHERPDEFLKQDINKLRPLMAEKEFNDLVAMRKDLAKDKNAPPRLLTTLQNKNNVIEQLQLSGEKNAGNRGRVESYLNQALLAAVSANGNQPLGEQEERDVINSTIIDIARNKPELLKPYVKDTEFQTTTQQIKTAELKLSTKYPDAKDKAKRDMAKARLRETADEIFRQFTHNNGGVPPTAERRQQIIDKLMTYGEIITGYGDGLSDFEGFYFEAQDREDIAKFVPTEP